MLLSAAEAQARGFPLPEGLSWDNITYTVGGTWKIRYLNTTGYFITWHFENGVKVNGSNQWNVATEEWVDYHPGEEKAYTCGGCHTTGYSTEGNQDGLPGLVGTWQFRGVTCESCHGPGSLHSPNMDAAQANPMTIDVSGEVCEQCHGRTSSGFPEYEIGNPSSLNISYGAAPHKHRQQFWDWNISEHSEELEPFLQDSCLTCKGTDNIFNTDLISLLDVTITVENATNAVTCTSCHSGHDLDLWITRPEIEGYPIAWELGSEADYNTVCMQCHTSGGTPETQVKEEWHHAQTELFNGSVHYVSDVTCTVCHMALDTKSAVAYDLLNHTMIANSYGTYDYSCGQAIGCHKEQGTAWAEQMIEEIQTTVNATLHKAEEAITEAEATIATANQTTGVNQTAIEEAESLLLQAKSYSSFVEGDGTLGFHNPSYALSLLSTSLDYVAKAESTALEARAAALDSDVISLTAQVSSLETQVTSLQNQTDTLQDDIEDLETKIDSLESTSATVPYLYGGLGLAIGFIVGAAIIFVVRRGKP